MEDFYARQAGNFQSPKVQGKDVDAVTPQKKKDTGWIERRGEEIAGTTYIRQYYLEKYGSAKKGFDPQKQAASMKEEPHVQRGAILR